MNPWGLFVSEVEEKLRSALAELGLEPPVPLSETLEEPPDPKLGDLASNVCFELAKKLGKKPEEVSETLVKLMKPGGLVGSIESVRGYLNFFVNVSKLAATTAECIERLGERYGEGEKRGKVIVEHTSINPTKPLHIGHGRNAVLGDTIARILRKLGYTVEVHNYIDDLGLQMAETLLAWEKLPRPKTKFDHALGLMYVGIQELLQKEPGLQEEVRKILRDLESGRKAVRRRARAIAEACVRANLQTSRKLGVQYDLLVWESDLVDMGLLDEVLELLKESGSLKQEGGALVLDLEKFGLGSRVLVRSDGTAVYFARDIAYQLWKFGRSRKSLRFKPWFGIYTTSPDGRKSTRFGRAQRVINVIGAEQRDVQRSVFAALKILGFEREFENSFHLAYEHVWLPAGKFSGRRGTWVGHSLDEAIEEAVARAEEVLRKRWQRTSPEFRRRISKIVGTGALRFSLLSTSPEKKITFRWEEALNLEKNSGPAIQYSHARACSILRKAGRRRDLEPDWQSLQLPEEKELVKLLAKYPQVLLKAGERLRPNLLTEHVSKLSSVFNSFYEKAPVLKAEKGLREARLKLVEYTKLVLADALHLLGIEAPARI
ncbi:MAG: arginine--tRNA ligase [Candidatus Hadarchaeales archaeon]